MGVRQRLMVAGVKPGLRMMSAERRQRWLVDVIGAASAACTPEECGALHRAIAAQQGTWPVSSREVEIHRVGLYAAVAETAAVPGAIVECGVGRGSSLVPLARANELFSPERQVIGFDSFEGFPAASRHDVGPRVTEDLAIDAWCSATSVETVRAALDAPCELVPGFFADSLPRSLPEQLSLLHVDCDLYESTRDVLTLGLPRMQPGSMVILDEYSEQDLWPGATLAIDEAFAPTPYRPAWDDLLGRFVVRIPPTVPQAKALT